ncbi:hypothetical protein, partial [Vibrio parahaemolyticus]|uniref:hypothetical protein n=2 Tax=Vibrio TaxID=662 RepID=UPI001C5D7A33
FFRSKLSVLAQEIGTNETPDVLCQKLSSILHGVHLLGITNLGMSDNSLASYRYTNAMQSVLLKQEWRSQPKGNQASMIIEAIKQSTQENQAMTGKFVP